MLRTASSVLPQSSCRPCVKDMHNGGSASVIRELVDHSPHHPAASRARAAFSTRPEMSHTTFTVPHMNEPPRRHDITIRVAKEAGRHTDPAAFAAAASQAAAGRDASILSAHTAGEIICVVTVPAATGPQAVAVALAVVADALRAGNPLPSPSR